MDRLSVLLCAALLMGCDQSLNETFTGAPSKTHRTEVCKNGVVYYLVSHSVSPAFKPDGSLYLCDSPTKEK